MQKKLRRQGYIYVLRNLTNGKEYVGQTVCGVLNRWRGHLHAAFKDYSSKPLYRAMRKAYERDGSLRSFTVGELWTGPESKLNMMERRFVRQRMTFIDWGMGYNLTTGGNHCKLSLRSKRKIAKAAREQWVDPAKRDCIETAIRLSAKSEVTIVRRRESIRAALKSEAVHKRISRAAKKRSRSSEGRAQLSAMATAAWARPEVRTRHKLAPETEARRVVAATAALRTPKTRRRLSKSSKAAWKDPERHVRVSDTLKALHAAHPEIRKNVGLQLRGKPHKLTRTSRRRISEASKARWADPVWRTATLKNMVGKKRSADGCANIRASQELAKKLKPEVEARRRAAIAAALRTPESREKMSKAKCANWADKASVERAAWVAACHAWRKKKEAVAK